MCPCARRTVAPSSRRSTPPTLRYLALQRESSSESYKKTDPRGLTKQVDLCGAGSRAVRAYVRVYVIQHAPKLDLPEQLRVHRRQAGRIRWVKRLELGSAVFFRAAGCACSWPPPTRAAYLRATRAQPRAQPRARRAQRKSAAPARGFDFQCPRRTRGACAPRRHHEELAPRVGPSRREEGVDRALRPERVGRTGLGDDPERRRRPRARTCLQTRAS